ncbi:hypothetical protein Acr_07g0012640 [Actinidia rufa]|uniref:Uncharacterized protein n=1 Tax=Actinidia rufa TaxID=165716 RepID=A0A7J0EXD3_9ERIC|nr:hypothetical protein Acr_07g0012640 [Actinidia rufa]
MASDRSRGTIVVCLIISTTNLNADLKSASKPFKPSIIGRLLGRATTSSQKVLEPSSTRTLPFPEFKARKRASTQGCRVTPLLNLQTVRKKKERKTLGQKKFVSAADPLSIAAPPINQVPLPAIDPVLALAIILSKDVVDLVEESLEEIKDLASKKLTAISEWMKKQSAMIKKSKKKISFLEKQAKLDYDVAKKARLELAAVVQERDTNNAAVIKAQEEMLEEKADEVLEKAPKVADELGQDRAAAAAVDRVVAEEASPNLSLDM